MKPLFEGKVLDIAHRGASSLAPENTKEAFLEAIKAGADVIELDIHLTKDKKVVVIHDSTINRTSNGRGLVSAMTLEELRKYDFGVGNEHQKIQTLPEALASITDHSDCSYILVEPKYSIKGYEQLVIDQINKSKHKERVWIHSSYRSILRNIRQIDPSIRLGRVLVFSWLHRISFFFHRRWMKKYRITFFSVSNIFPNRFFTSNFIKELKKHEVDVYIWTINDLVSAHYAIISGAKGLITNYPGIVKSVLKRYQKKR